MSSVKEPSGDTHVISDDESLFGMEIEPTSSTQSLSTIKSQFSSATEPDNVQVSSKEAPAQEDGHPKVMKCLRM